MNDHESQQCYIPIARYTIIHNTMSSWNYCFFFSINDYMNYTVGTAAASGVLFVMVFITMVLQETPEGVVVGWC